MNPYPLTRSVITPRPSLTRPTLAAMLGCALLLFASQQCARGARSKLDEVVKFGATMGPVSR